MKVKLGSIMWASHLPMLVRAGKHPEYLELTAFSGKYLEDHPEKIDEVLQTLAQSDVILLYRSRGTYWETIAERLQAKGLKAPIICVGSDPAYWMLSTVDPQIVAQVNAYISIGGEENFTNMLHYIARTVCHVDVVPPDPQPVPWEGLYHPRASDIFGTVEAYFNWYERYWAAKTDVQAPPSAAAGTVGILFSRHAWVNDNLDVENMLIHVLEDMGIKVIPTFSYSIKDREKGCKGSGEVVCETFLDEHKIPRIDALIKMQFFPLTGTRENRDVAHVVARNSADILKQLDVPVFSPITATYKTIDEWQKDPQGLGSNLIGFSIAMPEFEGVIEPFIIGARNTQADELARKVPLAERCQKYARRIANWVKLGKTPKAARKVAFILHNNPCASVEATVGGGSQLDTLESVAAILSRMQAAGYSVDPPADGKTLIDTIMDRKAISEFRWTTVDEIVSKGGVLKQVTQQEYEEWFQTLSPKVRKRMNKAWGNPPGEEVDGVPPAMVYEGKILVTGVTYGNAAVCVQPKRGCAGPRCDGQVCKILHDPDIPPPHQYMATYRYIERDFGAHVIIHVGTHGNLEFLPGKSVGLSGDCYPDMAIGDLPHLYIYNADNPPEGTIAKRRSYAVLVNHMQTVMTQGGLYEKLEDLDRLLGEYEQARGADPHRAHTLQHLIMDAIQDTGLDHEIKVDIEDENGRQRLRRLADLDKENRLATIPFDHLTRSAHGVLSRIRNTQIQDGLHVFGSPPEEERRVDYINAILRYDAGETVSLRKSVAAMMGLDIGNLLENSDAIHPDYRQSQGKLLEEIDTLCKAFIRRMLTNGHDRMRMAEEIMGNRLKIMDAVDDLDTIREKVLDLDTRIGASLEIDALLHGFEGGYIPPGPSGLITRGRDDILPTGRNFYSLDPYRVPTGAAWEIGQQLARTVIDKHLAEEDRYPENIAIFWMAGDILYADGEGMAQMISLLGVKPL